MVRFACPGCGATFAVDSDKAGKTGQCPKCRDQFVIPAAGAAGPQASGPAVEIAPCPGCAARLSVAPGDVGVSVECPYCKSIYTATSIGGAARKKEDHEAYQFTSPNRDEERPRRRRDRDESPPRRRNRSRGRRRYDGIESKRIPAALFALLLGWLGVHKFYLGYPTPGIILLILGLCTGTSWVIGLVEGIIYLTKTDEEFIETYQINEQQWF